MRFKNKLKNFLKSNKFLKKIGYYFVKRRYAYTFYNEKLSLIDKWAWKDSETSNFYYDLEELNILHLSYMIENVTKVSHKTIISYFNEILEDDKLRETIKSQFKLTPQYNNEIKIGYGRRIAWYALVRVIKPSLIVETGVYHGVGSLILTSALLKNKDEGFEGRYIGTDINQDAGSLLVNPYLAMGEILYGDSIDSLNGISEKIDLFINDSDHDDAYEYEEYLTIKDKLSSKSIIVGDNCHCSDSLPRFSEIENRKFIFFSEKPKNHWYPGGGIGISYLED